MRLKYLIIFVSFVLLGMPVLGSCDIVSLFAWKSNYYRATPNRQDITAAYCKQHEPGTVTAKISELLKNGAVTDRSITLSNYTLNQHIKDGVYFMYGTFLAKGVDNGKPWQDQIKYLAYKLTENGETFGVWTTPECKGFYTGKAVLQKPFNN